MSTMSKTKTTNSSEYNKNKAKTEKLMEEKISEIQSLRDELVKVKMEKIEYASKVSNILSLNSLRAEIQKADSFIRSILKENLISYAEDFENKLSDNMFIHKEEPIKKLKDKTESMYNCNCDSCLYMRKSTSINQKWTGNTGFVSKEFLVSKNVNCMIKYYPTSFTYQNSKMVDNIKMVNLRSKETKFNDIEIQFTMAKVKDNSLMDFDFSVHRIIPVMIEGTQFMVSYASIMVVEAMRSLRSEKAAEFLNVLDLIEEKTCFKKFVQSYLNIDLGERIIFKMSDLTAEEEMVLLSEMGLDDIYVKSDELNPVSNSNHISREEFKEGNKIKAYLLTTPLFREIRYFAEEEDNFEMIDADKMLIDMNNSTSSPDSAPLVVVDHEGKAVKRYLDQTISRDKFVKWNYLGVLASEWSRQKFLDYYKDRGMSEAILTKIMNTHFSSILFENRVFDPYLVRLFFMHKREFKAMAYFFGNLKDFEVAIISSKITVFKQMHLMTQKMFYEKFKNILNLDEINFDVEFLKFLREVDDMDEFKVESMHVLRELFKNRIFNYIYLYEHVRNDDGDNNQRYNSMDKEEREDIYIKNRREIQRSMNSKEMHDILTYQPNMPTKEFFKNNPEFTEDFQLEFNMGPADEEMEVEWSAKVLDDL